MAGDPPNCNMCPYRNSISVQYKPEQKHASRCPVCDGTGVIKIETNTTAGNYTKVCHGCRGCGWVSY